MDDDEIETTDLSSLPRIEGRSIYLGHFMPHYGHFLLEMLSSFWTFDTFHSYDAFIFHPFVFGEAISSYIEEAFQAFGIPLEKVKLITTKTIVDDITIPERLVKLNKSAKLEARQIYFFLTRLFTSNNQTPTSSFANKYYFSRVRISLKTGQRAIINEPFMEKALSRMGFITIYPELLSFSEQVVLIHHADVICGLSGSALHNCVFMNPEAILIEILDARSPTATHPMQQICNELSQATTYFIPFEGYILNREQKMSIINSRKVTLQIAEILCQYGLNSEAIKNIDWNFTKQGELFQTNCLMIGKNSLRLLKSWLIPKKFLK